jgi:hypothetical protein
MFVRDSQRLKATSFREINFQKTELLSRAKRTRQLKELLKLANPHDSSPREFGHRLIKWRSL